MAPGANFQTSDGGAFPMANRPNLPRQAGGASASSAVSPAIVGAGVGVGVLILAIIIGVAVRIQIVRKRHQRAMAQLEQGIAHSPSRQMEQIARPVSAARCGSLSLMPIHGQAGWDALYSNDTVNEPEQPARPDKRQRMSVSLPKRIRQSKGLRLKGLKHLSAIMESLESPKIESQEALPLPRQGSPQAIATADRLMGSPKSDKDNIGLAQSADHAIEANHAIESDWAQKTNRLIQSVSDEYLKAPDSPRPNVKPCFTIDSPSRYGAAIANDENSPPKVLRSVSTGVLDTDSAVFGYADRIIRNPKRRQRPEMHSRSVLLGAPLSRPPSGPVPPIPVTVQPPEQVRQGVCVSVSRESSSSSMNSAGSSVLVTSPILKMHGNDMPAASPTVEEVVAEDDRAELKSVLNRQWQNPNITVPRPNISLTNMNHRRVRSSVKGSIRYDSESALSNRMSTSSLSSDCSKAENRLSIPQIATADRISISRVSSSNSLVEGSAGRVQKVDTPPRRRSHRVSSVSASGSPAARDRRRNSVLRDISGNKRPSPRRQMSISTQDSACSSNGNPFHWDTNTSNVLPKPSAMKGSPNARKNHRRHNCVRISTLTPEVLGPSGQRSRSSSPTGIVMDDILEERESDEIKREVEKERAKVERAVANERRRSRPPMPPRNISSDSCLRIQKLRASLTPSSPTLSTWNAYDQYGHNTGGLSSHPSDSNMSVSPLRSRNSSRMSNRSSGNFVIPKFPSPSKARASIAVTVPQPDTAPMPEFSVDLDMESPTLGFHDQKNSSSPFGLAVSEEEGHSPVSPEGSGSGDSEAEFSPVSPVDMPSSPPLPISTEKEYEPDWLPVVVDLPAPTEEYDPASPPLMWNGFSSDEAERSSGLWLPFAIKDEEDVSPKSRPTSYAAQAGAREQDDSPPLSPKTVPSSIPDLSTKKSEKLTSSNASSVMAGLPHQTSASNFLGVNVPVLAPPTTQDTDNHLPQWQLQQPSTHVTQRSTHRRQRSISNVRTPRPTTAQPPPLPTIPQSSSPPSAPSPAPAPLNIGQKIRKSVTEGHNANRTVSIGGPKGPREAPAKSVLKNAMALRRMKSQIQSDRGSRESRNFARLGREPSPLLPWIGTENEDGEIFAFDFDTMAGAASSSSESSPMSFSDDERKTRFFGVPQVDVPTTSGALDEVSFETLEKVIEGALAGFDAEHRASVTPKASAFAYGQGYNSNTSRKRDSNVWDDGEEFWSSNAEYRPESLELPQFQRAGDVTPRKEEQTVDPRLLSTPMGSVQATPRSLYDADGFLKA